jgi:hypothetical protein
MTRKRPYQKYLKLVAKDGRAVDEMADFDTDMLHDELAEIVGELRSQHDEDRRRALIQAWLADMSKAARQ